MTLANQPILIHNYKNPRDKKELLTEDEIKILTTPQDLANFKDDITEALYKGVQRNIVMKNQKNVVGE